MAGSGAFLLTAIQTNSEHLATTGGGGREAGMFHWPHMVATDSQGNLYIGEVDGAARAQRYLRYGATGCSGTGNTNVGEYIGQ